MHVNKKKNIILKNIKALLVLLIFMGLPFVKLVAQPIPVGDIKEEQFRILQLLSDSTVHTSFDNRPIWASTYNDLLHSNNFDSTSWWGQSLQPKGVSFSLQHYKINVGPYDPVFRNTYNSALPYGENNGAAWYGNGMNSELQAGFYVTSKYFTITLRPHLIYTQNSDFEVPRFIPRYPNGDVRYVAPGFIPEDSLAERIDMPFRFGPDSYETLDWGQSSVRLHYDALEAGISKETLWWGPGVRYALALSNNAAGLPHAFIGTRKPINLPFDIGDMEFRWIFAWPHDSPYFDLNVDGTVNPEDRLDKFKTLSKTRFMNGLNVTYSPSFLPNLSIGVIRIIQQYVPEGGLSVGDDLLGVFKAFPKPGDGYYHAADDASNYETKDPLSSVYFRWVLPESDAEFYGEYYKEDQNVNSRDFLMEPQHGRAYTIGLQKLLEFDGPIDFVHINIELNSLLPGRIDDLRPQTYYYTHHFVKQGHTNRGQILGAAIGPGSTSQYLGIEGYFKYGKLGIFAQRETINDHFHYERIARFYSGGGFKDQIHHRENLNLGLNGSYKLGPILLNGKFTWNKNFNYGRFDLGKRAFYTIKGHNIINLQYQLSVRYLF